MELEEKAVLKITVHAIERAKERLSWNETVLTKMANKAFYEGLNHSTTKGSLHKYIDMLWFQHKNCNNIRIYGENIYFFAKTSLVTIFQLPNNLRKYVKYSKQ